MPTTSTNPVQCALTAYWQQRAASYATANQAELRSQKAQCWADTILALAASSGPKRILDVGTGPGFLAIILAKSGHSLSAIDASDAMLAQASENAKQQQVEVQLLKGDAHQLPLPDNYFDLVVSRNVMWNLHNPAHAYSECCRVLKPYGKLIVFDANWYLHLFEERYRRGYATDRHNTLCKGISDHYSQTDTTTMEQIAKQLPLSQIMRPQWDVKLLLDFGMRTCMVDTQIWQQLWDEEEKINYHSTPMFVIVAQK